MEKLVTLKFVRVGLELALGLDIKSVSTEGGAVVVAVPTMGMGPAHAGSSRKLGRDFTIREVWDLEVAGFSGGDFIFRASGPSLELLDSGRGGTAAWDRRELQLVGSIYGAHPGRRWYPAACSRPLCRCWKIGPGRFKGRLACSWPCCCLCDFGLISSPFCASTVPSLQWGQGEAELWDPQDPSQLCPLSAGLLSLPGRTGVFLSQGLFQNWEVAHCFPPIWDGKGVNFGALSKLAKVSRSSI